LLGLPVDDFPPGTEASSRLLLAASLARGTQVLGRFGVLAHIYRHGIVPRATRVGIALGLP